MISLFLFRFRSNGESEIVPEDETWFYYPHMMFLVPELIGDDFIELGLSESDSDDTISISESEEDTDEDDKVNVKRKREIDEDDKIVNKRNRKIDEDEKVMVKQEPSKNSLFCAYLVEELDDFGAEEEDRVKHEINDLLYYMKRKKDETKNIQNEI